MDRSRNLQQRRLILVGRLINIQAGAMFQQVDRYGSDHTNVINKMFSNHLFYFR